MINILNARLTAFHVSMWTDKHSAENLFVTGSKEEDDKRIYQTAYGTMFSFLMLGKEEYPKRELPAKEMKPYPKTVEEADQYLMEELSLKDKMVTANVSADEVGELHFSVGNYIGNSFELRDGNNHLMWSCAKEAGRGVLHEDEASAIILSRLALALEKMQTV